MLIWITAKKGKISCALKRVPAEKLMRNWKKYEGENLMNGFLRVFVVCSAIAGLIFAGNFMSEIRIGGVGVVSNLLSIVLLIPLWLWCRDHRQKMALDNQVKSESTLTTLFWVLTLFFSALVIRIPSVLLFGWPYEKTPLVYLVVLFIVVLKRNDVSAFGFKTVSFGRAALLGAVFYGLLGFLPLIFSNFILYVLQGQTLIESFDPWFFLFIMPFQIFCVGLSEEGLFRGYMQTSLSRVISNRKAIFLQAALFGLWHFVWHISPLDWFGMMMHVGNTFVWGLLVGHFYGVTANITPLVLAHGLYNGVLQSSITNPKALQTLNDMPLFSQLLFSLAPFVVGWAVTFMATKFLVRKILPSERQQTII